jgi:hypothetical protein
VDNLAKLNSLYQEMVPDVIWLQSLVFGKLQEPCIGYANQEAIQMSQIDMVTAAMINYSLPPGMTIRYIKGEYVGKNRNVKQIIEDISPHIDEVNADHAKCILTQGCPSRINFEETFKIKVAIIEKGNQATFKMYPKIVSKTMNKEDDHSHLLQVKLWVLRFSPYCHHMAQGMLVNPGKNP